MFSFAAILALVPLAAFFVSRRWSEEKISGARTAGWMLALFGVGLLMASPFLTSRGVGTGEAYNYSIALADGVEQLRAGDIPPLVGQTEFAFNGRVHPLRNAPYLFYLAGVLDALTFHRLSFWELQNLSLALSFVLSVFACYGGLRWGTGCPRPVAFALAAVYGLSPAVLVNGTVNLFMTVHVAVFVPLAIGACVRQCRRPSVTADIALAAALAGAWLAHPPVALWLTAGIGFVRLLILWRNPAWQARAGLLGAALLGLALAGFVFASVTALSDDLGYFPNGEDVRANYVIAVMASIHAAFPGVLRPVSAGASLLTDIQFGYVTWELLVVAILLWLRRPSRPDAQTAASRLAGLGLIGLTVLFLVLLLPIPHVTRWLWTQTPIAVQTLTAIWPMQRLYLVATGFTIFAAALAMPRQLPSVKLARIAVFTAVCLSGAWMLHEAWSFVAGGFAVRWSDDSTKRSHLSSNLDLTETSYAFLGLSPTFVNGVMDPLFEFRLLKSGRKEIASPLATALATAPIVARGDVFQRSGQPAPVTEVNAPQLVLEPGKRYLLNFNFLTPPLKGVVEIVGPALLRHYALPAAGKAEGFGMEEGHQHSVSLWTSLDHPEPVEVRLSVTEWPANLAPNSKIAEFTLQAADLTRLPVHLEALLPLRCTVESPEAGCFLSTPRRYIPGYAARVNGRSARPIRSPEGYVMLPVQPGHNVVELDYLGPPLVRWAFWVSACAWLGLLVWAGGAAWGFNWGNLARRGTHWTLPLFAALGRHLFPVVAVTVVAVVAVVFWRQRDHYLNGVGPVRIRLLLPLMQTGRQQPILVTGQPGAGTNVFVGYLDDSHIRIGADIWGSLVQTDPLWVDYFQPQDLVINSSALYPLDHPKVRSLDPSTRERLRNDFRVELNGHAVLALPRSAYESTVDQVTVGVTRIGGSLTQTKFSGEILSVERLPFPRSLVVAKGHAIKVRLRFPLGRAGISETLLSLGPDGAEGICCVTYERETQLRFSRRAADGTILDSCEQTYDPSQDHEIEFILGPAPDRSRAGAVAWKFDGVHFLGPADVAAGPPHLVLAGLSRTEASGIEARFTGPKFVASVVPSGPPMPPETTGALQLIVTFPRDKIGRPEPLVTTGRTGVGDFAYVTYVDEHHVRFGLDHWGVGGAMSEPIEIDYAMPHEIEISLGSLYPAETKPNPELQRRKAQMEIRFDGRTVVRAAYPAHPSTADEITVGANRIGGSNCDPAFAGEIHSVQRLGWPQ